ncbi:hypothetical protein D3Z62_23160, partial [Lachnospiraceae bacterium]|nr:hypothetical protein [Lachnospiraceae bacterium]
MRRRRRRNRRNRLRRIRFRKGCPPAKQQRGRRLRKERFPASPRRAAIRQEGRRQARYPERLLGMERLPAKQRRRRLPEKEKPPVSRLPRRLLLREKYPAGQRMKRLQQRKGLPA